MTDSRTDSQRENGTHSVAREPKFCRCRLCHAHFYGETITEARRACLEHQREEHPEWSDAVCYCPD